MSSVMNPIGPEEPSVYWRRRLIVGLAILIVLIILVVLLRSCSSGGTPVAAPTSSSPSATNTSSSTASPSSSSSASASGAACADSDIQVTVAPNNGTSFSPGESISFTMSIKNISSKACQRNVGTKPNTVKITSGGVDVWSSDDCAPPGEDNIQTIQPGDMYQLSATWNQKLSSPTQCTNQSSAQAGGYDVVGINDQVKSDPVAFSIK